MGNCNLVMQLKIGVTLYDADNQLWETKIGTNDKKMNLLYSAWGKTEQQSKENAQKLIQSIDLMPIN